MRAPRWPVAALLLCSACGGVGRSADASILIVPESYREAMNSGGHLRHVGARLPDGGRIACRDCHELDQNGFTSPEDRPCQRCHEDRASFHHGPADGGALPDGGALTCFACHPFTGEGPRPSTPWTCLTCHAEPIGHAVAVKAHEAACFYCHRPHEEPFTQPTDCTVCHPESAVHGAKGRTVAEGCMKCHERHTLAPEASKHCVACHADAKEVKSKRAVVTRQALFEGHPSCGSCHVPHRFLKKDVTPCTRCHEDQVVLARALLATVRNDPRRAAGHARCAECHDPHGGQGAAPRPCESCHQKVKSDHPPPEGKPDQACLQCHPIHQALRGVDVAKACIDCHDEGEFSGIVHAKDKETGAPLACSKCHPPHAFKQAADKASCKACHQATVLATAKMKKAGHAKCEECHQGLPHKPLGDRKACLACHEGAKPRHEGHDECATCHETHSGARLKGCVDCHEVKELPGLHVVAEHQKCEACHAAHGSQPYGKRATCLAGCHEKEVEHEPKAERCYACHLYRPPKPGDTAVELKKRAK